METTQQESRRQRIADFKEGADVYARWLELPEDRRRARTPIPRCVQTRCEFDIEFGRWKTALRADTGDMRTLRWTFEGWEEQLANGRWIPTSDPGTGDRTLSYQNTRHERPS